MSLLVKLLSFLPSVISGVKEDVSKKREIQKLEKVAGIELRKAELKGQIERARSNDTADAILDKESIENTGWKDEYLLIITTTPMVLLFLSPFVDIYMAMMYMEDFTYNTGLIQRAVGEGFTSLKSAPELYWYLLFAVYIHSLGMRKLVRTAVEKLVELRFGK